MKPHLYNALSGIYCFAFAAIWFGCSILVINSTDKEYGIGLEETIYLLIATIIPFHIFENTRQWLYEYGIYRKRLFLKMPISLIVFTVSIYVIGTMVCYKFCKSDKVVPFERVYGMVAGASFLFSNTLALLRWHFRSVPEMWHLSHELLSRADNR